MSEPQGRWPFSVLFACTMNRVRSPMAAALLARRAEGRIFVDSCGLLDTAEPDPMVFEVMADAAPDLARRPPKTFEAAGALGFDLIVCLSEDAREAVSRLARASAVDVEFWPVEDPTLTEGSRAQRLEAYGRVRRDLERRIAARFPAPAAAPTPL